MGTAHILLLDPDDEIATQFDQACQAWVVGRARTLAEAFKLLTTFSYDLAIIEMLLPDAAGTDAWTVLRERQPNLFGILTTSSPSLHSSINTNNDRILAYLLKPLKMEDVCNYVAKSIEPESGVTRPDK